MSSVFSVPILSRADIVSILAQSQIANIREDDLVNPSPDFASALYAALLTSLDTLQEDTGQIDFGALEQLENPDLHIDSVRIMNLCNKLREVMAAVSCPLKFNLKDLIRPDTQRTGVFLSSILNFCLYKETKMNLLEPIAQKVSEYSDQHAELEAKISQLKMEIAEHKEASKRELPLVQELDAKVKELRQTIQGLNNHQVSLKASFGTMKKKGKEIDEKISSAEFALVQGVQENAKLRSKIVQSPDKLQAALEEKKSLRVDVKNSEKSAIQSFQDKNSILEVYSKALKKMSKHLAQMQDIQEQVNSAKSIDKDVNTVKAKLSADGVLDMSLEAKLVERQGKAEQLEELKKALTKERDLKVMEADKELNNVRLDVESKRHSLEARQRKVEAMVAEADSLSLQINSVSESGAAKQQELRRKSEEIANEFHHYSNSVGLLLPRIDTEPEIVKRS